MSPDRVDRRPRRADDVTACVGATPLVRIDAATPEDGATLWGKCEFLEPGGSLKDRIAAALLDAAEEDKGLEPGGLVVEASSGNTAVGLAQACAVRGYDLLIAIPEKMSEEKRTLVRAFGAEVVVTPNAEPGDPDHYHEVAKRLARERDGVYLDQFGSPANARVHEETTGPEIWEALEGQLDAFVFGAGTGGTITGVSRFLETRDRDVEVVCADPEGSVIHGGEAEPYKVEGIGDDFVPDGLDLDLVDGFEVVTDAEAFRWARRLVEDEGLLAGGSSGACVAAARRVAERLPPEANVATILADTGRNYLSTFLDDDWLAEEGLADAEEAPAAEAPAPTPGGR